MSKGNKNPPTGTPPTASTATPPATPPVAGATQLPAGSLQANGAEISPTGDVEAQLVTLRHTTPYPVYRREGLELKQQPDQYRVTAQQLEVLAADPWVEIIEPADEEVSEE